MHKIACVFSFRESSWVSCQKIVFNLHKAYEQIPDVKITNFDYGHDSHYASYQNLANDIFTERPDTIVIMDHKPHPYHFLKFLLQLYSGKRKPLLSFHVFGDFTLYYNDWENLGWMMAGFQVEFIVASDRQKILIDKFLVPPQTSRVCPFPVKVEDFSYRAEERTAQRKEWGVDDKEMVFTFTGRISRQKRIHQLLKTFHEALTQETEAHARLYIYGQPDHVGDQFLNVWDHENEYFRKVFRVYRELPESTRSRIHFMGGVPNSELRSVYAGADYLVNLSVHNDEDYGMSVAEAQMTGLPAILTDWGGLASFEHPELPEATRFVKVSFGMKSKIVSSVETIAALRLAMTTPRMKERKKLMQLACEKFSIESGSKKLISIYAEEAVPFESFSPLHKLVAKRNSLGQGIYLTKELTLSKIYLNLYSSYVRNS